MCTHIRRDLACGHHRFFVHMFCKYYYATGHRCDLYVIHREYWPNRICNKDCSEYNRFLINSPVAQRRISPPRPRFNPQRQTSPRVRHQHMMASSNTGHRGVRGVRNPRSPPSWELRYEELAATAQTQAQVQMQQ